jgi:hypothetical protein
MANVEPKVSVKKVKAQVNFADRIKGQLTTGVLKGQMTVNDLTMLEEYLKKLKAVLS